MNTNEIKASNRLIRVGSCPFVVKGFVQHFLRFERTEGSLYLDPAETHPAPEESDRGLPHSKTLARDRTLTTSARSLRSAPVLGRSRVR